MTMRPLILAAFVFFTLALVPAARAQTVQPPPGSSCHSNSDCPSGYSCTYNSFTFYRTCSKSTSTPTPTPTPVPTTPSPTLQSTGNTTQTQSTGNSANTSNSGSGQNMTLINPLGAGTSLPVLLKDILQLIVQIGTVVIVLMLVYVGFLFVTARGNESKITAAREALLWTVVGALILLGAQAISLGIQSTVQALSTGP